MADAPPAQVLQSLVSGVEATPPPRFCLPPFLFEKGFGFFKGPDCDVFAHITVFQAAGIQHPAVGEYYRVEVKPSMRKPGLEASKVERLTEDEGEREKAWAAHAPVRMGDDA